MPVRSASGPQKSRLSMPVGPPRAGARGRKWHDARTMPSARVLLAIPLLLAAACNDERDAKIDALEARVAELERRTTDTSRAIEPLAALPNAVEQQQQSATTIRNEQATLVARLARAEEAIAALQVRAATASPPLEVEATAPASVLPKTLEVGVPECDEYLRKYLACIEEKMPAGTKTAMIEALESTSKAWREAATGPARTALGEACRQANEAAGKAFASMGCTW